MKILHVGGFHSCHVRDIMLELHKLNCYEQRVLSYKKVNFDVFKGYYSNDYVNYYKRGWKSTNIVNLVTKINREFNPNIVIGHSLTYSCIPLTIFKKYFNTKTLVIPWSIHTILKQKRNSRLHETDCLKSVNRFLYPKDFDLSIFDRFYKVHLRQKLVNFRSLVNVSQYLYFDRIFNNTVNILSARPTTNMYYHDWLLESIPQLIKINKNLKVTFLVGQIKSVGISKLNQLIKKAKQLKIDNYCVFISKSLSQNEYSNIIKCNDIIYSLANHDAGFAGATLQSLASNAIVITQKTKLNKFLNDRAILVNLNKEEVINKIVDVVKNKDFLLNRTINILNNKMYFQSYDKDKMVKNLEDIINE